MYLLGSVRIKFGYQSNDWIWRQSNDFNDQTHALTILQWVELKE